MMAEALNRPRSTLSDQLHRLAGQGRITLTPGRHGLAIEASEPVQRAKYPDSDIRRWAEDRHPRYAPTIPFMACSIGINGPLLQTACEKPRSGKDYLEKSCAVTAGLHRRVHLAQTKGAARRRFSHLFSRCSLRT